MEIQFAVFINIILAALALYYYYIGSRQFYLKKPHYLRYLAIAIILDAITAILGSFGITPTTQIPGSDYVPWRSILFICHVVLATIGFFGFIILLIVVLVKGKDLPYPRLRIFQYKILLPMWITGESIALLNSLGKILFGIRLYDYI